MTSISVSASSAQIEQIFMFAFISFLVSMVLTPLYTTAAFSGKWWKQTRTKTVTGEQAKVYQKLHADKHRRNIPTMAGIIFVMTITLVTVAGNLSRSETWLPLAAMAGAGLIGLIDDIINVRGIGGRIAGMRAKVKALLLVIVATIGAWWFFSKLNVTDINVPFAGQWHLGWI